MPFCRFLYGIWLSVVKEAFGNISIRPYSFLEPSVSSVYVTDSLLLSCDWWIIYLSVSEQIGPLVSIFWCSSRCYVQQADVCFTTADNLSYGIPMLYCSLFVNGFLKSRYYPWWDKVRTQPQISGRMSPFKDLTLLLIPSTLSVPMGISHCIICFYGHVWTYLVRSWIRIWLGSTLSDRDLTWFDMIWQVLCNSVSYRKPFRFLTSWSSNLADLYCAASYHMVWNSYKNSEPVSDVPRPLLDWTASWLWYWRGSSVPLVWLWFGLNRIGGVTWVF